MEHEIEVLNNLLEIPSADGFKKTINRIIKSLKAWDELRNEVSDLKPYVVIEADGCSPVLVDYNQVINLINKHIDEIRE